MAALVLALGCDKRAGSGGGDARGDGARKGDPLRVAAAADLALAFKEIGAAFEKQTGKHVDFSFGSTGLLAKQIAEGAPFDVFAAANVSFVDDVVREGACLGETKALYARGRIVMWSKDPWLLPKGIEDLADPKYAKVALANPEHAPYGRAAREALTRSGAWETVRPRVVYGENVQQTLMFARSGNADVAIVALSLAVTSPGNYTPIDPALHEPLDQALVVCKGGSKGAKSNEANAFVALVGSEAGRAIMKRFGFLLPGEAPPAPTETRAP
ncbi:MAG: molybdate ABC transporter substrate-binding protein [Labilithrix sp.]|nr:molybdate ABC transporter substrate-binding protein [Labilithrix sp.]MCW5837292.1 molybdate ABC transporter substrate-binding protein [Labilithrix sp.]